MESLIIGEMMNFFWAIKNPYGFWELIIKSDNGQPRIKHGQKIKEM